MPQKTFKTINPANLKVVREWEYVTHAQIDEIVWALHGDYQSWKHSTIDERKIGLRKFAEFILQHYSEIANDMCSEMGKPIVQAEAEVKKCVTVCDYYIQSLERLLMPRMIEGPYVETRLARQSLGVVLSIMPWNFPIWQAVRFVIPAIVAGNTVVLKPSELSPSSAVWIEKGVESSFGVKLVRAANIEIDDIEGVIADDRVCGVTLTGSERAGRSVASLTGKYLKKTVLELGGNDPYLVLDGKIATSAANICTGARLANAGQVCISAKRWIVVEDCIDIFLNQAKQNFSKIRIGNPYARETELGPLASLNFVSQLRGQIERALKAGAKKIYDGSELLVNHEILASNGAYFAPVILDMTGVSDYNEEEFFGPVAQIYRVKNIEEAVDLANCSRFGLGAAVFSTNLELAQSIAMRLDAGLVAVNDFVKSDARVPFGGVKKSGYGKELGDEGFFEFTNLKMIGSSLVL